MKRKRESKDSVAVTGAGPTVTKTKAKVKTNTVRTQKSILKKTTAETAAAPKHAVSDRPAKKAKGSRETGRLQNDPRGARDAAPAAPARKGADRSTTVVLGDAPATIQIVAGSYDRTLHGVTATLQGDGGSSGAAVKFADTFLFNAHASAVRCLALSPPSVPVPGQGQKVMLATGSTDERINIYHLSAHPPASTSAVASASRAGAAEDEEEEERRLLSAVAARPVMPRAESAKNRELGTLLHHASSVTALAFPTRSKLLSAAEDSTIAVTRTRDWSLLSTIRVPVPKASSGSSSGGVHRPSGDTAPPGGAPAGVNGFAVHPSMKVMLSVSRGERCMRLWNLVTGKKAGVLNFGRDLVREVSGAGGAAGAAGGKLHHAAGEGRQVVWGRSFPGDEGSGEDEATDEYAIGFDRNVVVFGMDSLPRCKVLGDARTKTHDFHYFEVDGSGDDYGDDGQKGPVFSLLAVATEDGRILLSSTRPADLVPPPAAAAPEAGQDGKKTAAAATPLPTARLVGVIGGKAAGIPGRVKAFKVLSAMQQEAGGSEPSSGTTKTTKRLRKVWYVVAASSTGALRIWKLTGKELREAWANSAAVGATSTAPGTSSKEVPGRQIGELLGMYQTQDRITCVEAFVMIPRPEGLEDSEDELGDVDEENDEDEEEDE